MAAVNRTADKLTIERGGFPSVGPKVGLIQATVNLVTLVTANDTTDVFALPAGTLVIAAGFEVVVATTNGVTASLGLYTTSAGSRTEFAGELATNGAVGTNLSGGETKANIMVSTAGIMSLEISGDPGAAEAQVRVWAIIADTKDMA